ncbi:hypothetical protein SERLA73DRAFT_188722 [Serpula lacrymans var. lacrymans S7.3]|uniref:Uncharacterized protein n=1 Tax=Serpula lacrymans var. lacrymans (strain S7.3) TaxID=936435 RepID=F8QC11_SERL3|nr:hypothetical protein SERLA73DRAFT_188722 [Serpula lacrymans var. lacrymans S7.3]
MDTIHASGYCAKVPIRVNMRSLRSFKRYMRDFRCLLGCFPRKFKFTTSAPPNNEIQRHCPYDQDCNNTAYCSSYNSANGRLCARAGGKWVRIEGNSLCGSICTGVWSAIFARK